MFVDDAEITRAENLQIDLNMLQLCLDTWLMKVNPTKGKLMKMGQSEKKPNYYYHLAGDK